LNGFPTSSLAGLSGLASEVAASSVVSSGMAAVSARQAVEVVASSSVEFGPLILASSSLSSSLDGGGHDGDEQYN